MINVMKSAVKFSIQITFFASTFILQLPIKIIMITKIQLYKRFMITHLTRDILKIINNKTNKGKRLIFIK